MKKQSLLIFSLIITLSAFGQKKSDTLELKPIYKSIKFNNSIYTVDSTGIHEPKQEGVFLLKLDINSIQAIYQALDKSTDNHMVIKSLEEYLSNEVKKQQSK